MKDWVLFAIFSLLMIILYAVVDDNYQDKMLSNDEITQAISDSIKIEKDLRAKHI